MSASINGADAALHAGEDEEASASDEQQGYDKTPDAYFRWLQSLRTRLIRSQAIEEGSQGSRRDHDGGSSLTEVALALEQKHEAWILTESEAMLRNSLSVYLLSQRQNAADAPLSDLDALEKVVESHRLHTINTAASGLAIKCYNAYASLLANLHYTYNGVVPVDDELTLIDHGADDSERDLVLAWTGLEAGVSVLQDGCYASLGSLKLPTRTQAQTAGVVEQWDALLSVPAIRSRLHDAYIRASGHYRESQQVFAIYHQFALTHLPDQATGAELSEVDSLYQSRLSNPHEQIDASAQSYSSFVSRRHAAADYERIMTDAYTIITVAKHVAAACDSYEEMITTAAKTTSLTLPSSAWQAWKPYISWASGMHLARVTRRAAASESLGLESVCAIFERALFHCGLPPSCHDELEAPGRPPLTEDEVAARRGKESRQMRAARLAKEEQAVRSEVEASSDIWRKYIAFLVTAKASPTLVQDMCERACRAVPSSGSLRGQVLRTFGRTRRPSKETEKLFSDALAYAPLTSHVDSLVELLLARIDNEREAAAAGCLLDGQGSNMQEAHALVVKSTDAFMNVFSIISFALDVLDSKAHRDAALRLEMLLSNWCLHGPEGTQGLAEARWEMSVQQQSDNALTWLSAARYHTALSNFKKARNLYKGAISRKSISGQSKVEAAEALLQLEHIAGSIADVEWARTRLEKEREQQWTEYYSTYASQVPETMEPTSAQADVEMADKGEIGEKRKASQADASGNLGEFHLPSSVDKRGRRMEASSPRDRENSSVMVDNLSAGCTEQDIIALFKDCGDIRECIGPKAIDGSKASALVEFVSRESVPGARSRNEKFIEGSQILVQLGWQCTLYVTNFPASHDSDEAIRALFSSYGRIFDVRWPSKKFASNRRFCYVVFCNALDAQAALHLHNTSLDEGSTAAEGRIQVLISDPNRRKVRSDAFNDDRELFVSGIPRGISEDDVRAILDPGVSDVRFLRTPDGRPRGLAYVDMVTALDAQRVIGQTAEHDGGGYRLKGKLIHVVLVDKSKGHGNSIQHQGSLKTDINRRNLCVQLHGLPGDAQEAIIQQVVERACGNGSVQRVLWTPGEDSRASATVEFHDAAVAGKIALKGVLHYDAEHTVTVRPLGSSDTAAHSVSGSVGSPKSTTDIPVDFAPRQARGISGAARRGARGGLGFTGQRRIPASNSMDVDGPVQQKPDTSAASTMPQKKQDAFRAMLNGK